jgi:hypothetical protein
MAKATARVRELALDHVVVLKQDATQDKRDRYGRLLAYVWLLGGKDLGFSSERSAADLRHPPSPSAARGSRRPG